MPATDQARRKREASDVAFDYRGGHVKLSYRDALNPLRGVKFHLKIDDLKKIIKRGDCNTVEAVSYTHLTLPTILLV